MYEFRLPDVGEGIHEAAIVNWRVEVGDEVALDQPLVEVETDKALVEIPAPVAGTIAEIPLAQGTTAHVGDILVVIQEKGKTSTASVATTAALVQPESRQAPPAAKPGIAGPKERVLAAPAVRKLALELGVDLRQVSGSAAGGRVTADDVRRFSAQPSAPVPETASEPAPTAPAAAPAIVRSGEESVDREPLQGLRRRIAERMEQAWRVPHVTAFEDVNVTKLAKLRGQLNRLAESQNARLTYLPLIIKVVLQALKEFPYFNATLDMAKQEISVHRYYHIGIATAIPEGLVVPVVRHADQLSLLQLSVELNRLAELARQRKLDLKELSGSTFTITNYGSFHGQQGTPIINPPETAILGCGRIEDKPVAVKGKVKVRPVLPLALSYDHRLIDGAAGAQFLLRIKTLLADPNHLFLHL